MLKEVSRNQIVRQTGEWLRRFPWQWFLTLTFKRPNVSVATAERHFKAYIVNNQPDAIYFYVIEKHHGRDCSHLHALVGQVEGLSVWSHGISEIERYDPALGAAYYVVKSITDPYVWWNIHANPSDLLTDSVGGKQ